MTRNMATWDRILRIVAGVGALSFYGALEAPWRYLTLFGLVLIGTALIGWCPLYTVLGIGGPPKAPPAA
ncbi:MAG TPA: DUF2892 domain-containing protein [Gemmatimonadales bacterium]|nr:DUF2892 domain-containing protein [Gemmatimonadales bacterium]